ncbi:hypothetical protein [Sulfurisphaera tokodaii]|uniref:Uncharacterized protein n=2 Tax=Sulfurisphaera tokodaii TaxID=111955 RepID=F9VPB0_SULTO|nr:hypothetical protein [Sulfurisphaera tokodaii]BAK54757.1 hypothetical protein STK_22055 [Sulfurisphaera tokodaii str. 7]HII73060.1 hypothetical protein [Sulfurisphaera tokodaii]
MVKIKLSVIEKLKNYGYSVTRNENKVIIHYTPPSIKEAMSSDEDMESENRIIEIEGEINGDEVIIKNAYIIEGNTKKRKMDLSELELWAEYMGEE